MDTVRLGLIGLGSMGSHYAQLLRSGGIRRCRLAAVCHRDPAKTSLYPEAQAFTTSEEMICSGEVDAVIIATPHFSHTTIGIDALQHGLHVLTDKPISVSKSDALRLLAARRDPAQVFGVIYNLRTRPIWRRLRRMVQSGELGTVRRIAWTATSWFRTEAYYQQGAWRGTWGGEGGGVLLNQCPHQFDLLQWIFGMPSRVRGFCAFGKYHDIEVEDEATAWMEFSGRATGIFIATTGETPGKNRLEVTGDLGMATLEGEEILWLKNSVSASEFSRTCPQTMEAFPDTSETRLAAESDGGNYVTVFQNFVDAILDGAPLLAPAEEGLHSLELANAILLSSLEERTVDLPLDAAAFDARLQQLMAGSRYQARG